MNLSLDTHQQSSLAKAIQVLTSPFLHERPQEWVREFVDEIRHMLGGETKAVFAAPSQHADLVVHPGYSSKDIDDYREYSSILSSTAMFKRTAKMKVATRRDAYGPHYDAVMQGPYGQDYLPRVEAFDSLTFTVPLKSRPSKQDDVFQLIVCPPSPHRPLTEHQVQLARVLYPALEAGVGVYLRLSAVQKNMAAVLDGGGGACAVFSLDGYLVHSTPALQKALMHEPMREDLMTRIREIAHSFGSISPEHVWAAANTRCTGALGPYTLTPTCVRDFTRLPSIVVAVTPPPPRLTLPSGEALRDRFDLTPQEARVTLQLAERRSNREIAAALSISIHTARHHVRHALEKLCVPRTKVRSLLSRSFEVDRGVFK